MIKPVEAEGVYICNLSGSVPVGEGRASLGLQGLHTKYSDGLSGYTAGYTGKVGDGDLSANYFEPADHKSEGRQVQVEYNMPFSKGGSVTSEQENLYHRAMAHYDDLMAA
jgi:outer membrane usher protein FimD/PapC